MSFKNTMKLIASNFSLVWKQVLYFVVCLIFILFLSYQSAKPIFALLKNNGIADEFANFFKNFFNHGDGDYIGFFEIIKHCLLIINDNFSVIYKNLILFFIFLVVLPYILFEISTYNLSSILYKKLSMNMNIGYFPNLIETLKKSILYALENILLSIPFLIIKVLSFQLYLIASKSLFGAYIGVVGLSAIFIFVDSLKITFFACYTGIAIDKDCVAPKALGDSFKITINSFWTILSQSIILRLLVIVTNGFLGLFTIFAGLIVSIPTSMVLKSIFYNVVYFNKTGQRYYMNSNYIFNPTQYSVKKDNTDSIN